MPPRIHTDLPLAASACVALPPGASRHVQVLRLQPGDAITLFDGHGGEWAAEVAEMGRKTVTARVMTHQAVDCELVVRVDLAVGMPAPKLEGLDFRGQDITVSSEDGPYMVIFLAHWCPHCNAEVPRLIDWRNSGAVPADLNVIGVATAVAKTGANYPPSTWFSNKGWPWPVLVDEADGDGLAGLAAQAYGATGWPYFVIVGDDGLVKVRVSGEVESAELQEIVAAALAS